MALMARGSKHWATVDRELQALHMLDVLALAEVKLCTGKTSWLYRLAEGINPEALSYRSGPYSSCR